MKDFLRYVFLQNRKRNLSLLLLTIVLGLIENTGILLLIPLLSVAGIQLQAEPHGFSERISKFFEPLIGTPSLESVLILYVALVGAFGFLKHLKNTLSQDTRFRTERNLRNRLFNALLRTDFLYLSTRKNSELTQTLSQEIALISFGISLVLQCAASIVLAAIYVLASAMVSIQAVVVFTAMICLAALCIRQFNKSPILLASKLRKSSQHFYEILIHYISGLKTIKTSRLEDQYSLQFREITDQMFKNEMEFSNAQSMMRWVYESLFVVVIGLAFYGSYLYLQISITSLILFLVIASRLAPRVMSIHQQQQQIAHLAPGFEALMKLIQDTENRNEIALNDSRPNPVIFSKALSLEKVSFTYPTEFKAFSLENISVTIPHGTSLGICGPSGSGKTTLIDIIGGVIPPQSGELTIDGLVLNTAERVRWRSQVCYLNQDPFLFSASVRENLCWGLSSVSDTTLWEALRNAQAAEFVKKLSGGLDSVITNNGSNISGGQRQRLALTRVFLKKPSLLILDEVTSQLDPENQEAIRQVLSELRGRITTIIVSHNESFLRAVDQKITLKAHTKSPYIHNATEAVCITT